jgi:lipopolysaccharide transport system ATP-binding protein
MRPIIELEGIAKRYRLGRIGSTTIRDSIERAWHRLRGKGGNGPVVKGDFWALRDLSFAVDRGEMVGVIGQNGAGKSTLLKILSRITEPTLGEAILRGRPASLLEVGTGFHPDLSGRENIFLNGAILGMRRHEIRAKFDEIVAFSEVEQFIDTPVKRYSSGMYVRLAFAIAAHLEPDILLVDEVLAVGDTAFQKKCLGKMDRVSKAGRTVLLVSHNLVSIQSLCRRALWLHGGRLRADGAAAEVVGDYLQHAVSQEVKTLAERQDRQGDGSARMIRIRIEAADGEPVIRSSSRLKITIGYRSAKPLLHPRFVISVYDFSDAGLFVFDSDAAGGLPETLPAEGSVCCETEPINLTSGRCYANARLLKGGAVADYLQQAAVFDVEPDDFHGSGKLPGRDWVLCLLINKWRPLEDAP